MSIFQEDLAWDGTSPRHICALKGYLLDFNGTIADRRWFDGDPQDAGTVIKNISRARPTQLDRNEVKSVIGLCEKLKDWARSLELSDRSWWLYYTTNFITELEQATGAKRDAMYALRLFTRPVSRALTCPKGFVDGYLSHYTPVS